MTINNRNSGREHAKQPPRPGQSDDEGDVENEWDNGIRIGDDDNNNHNGNNGSAIMNRISSTSSNDADHDDNGNQNPAFQDDPVERTQAERAQAQLSSPSSSSMSVPSLHVPLRIQQGIAAGTIMNRPFRDSSFFPPPSMVHSHHNGQNSQNDGRSRLLDILEAAIRVASSIDPPESPGSSRGAESMPPYHGYYRGRHNDGHGGRGGHHDKAV